MKNDVVESALLTLLYRANPDDFEGFEEIVGEGAFADIRHRSADNALHAIAEAATEGCEDQFVLVQALVLGARIDVETDEQATKDALESVAARVLRSVGADTERRADLRTASGSLLRGIRVTDAAEQRNVFAGESVLPDLEAVFAPWLTAEFNTAAIDHVTFTGKAAATAAAIMEATALYETKCTPAWKRDPYTKKDATHVQIELCTSLPYEECRRRIDPTKWPECNPYFNRVTKLAPPVGSAKDWYGRIQEEVGPGLNFSYYRTDLKVRYVEQAGLAATAFDLVLPPNQTGDGRVTIDRGFLAVIEEGTHRRVQMVKVYRIEDQTGKHEIPHGWVCPLWGQQMTLAGWSCAATVPMRKALKAWSQVMRDAVAITRCACGALHCDCEGTDKKPKPKAKARKKAKQPTLASRVAPLSAERFDVPLSSACRTSFTAKTAQACIAVPAGSKQQAVTGATQVLKAEFGQSFLPPHAAKITRASKMDALVVALTNRNTGLFLGRLCDTGIGVDVPFTLYDTGL
jgi:hypothetical protein